MDEILREMAGRLMAAHRAVDALVEQSASDEPSVSGWCVGGGAHGGDQISMVERYAMRRDRHQRALHREVRRRCELGWWMRWCMRHEDEALRRWIEAYVICGMTMQQAARYCGRSIRQCRRYRRMLGI